MRWIALLAVAGLTACNQPANDSGLCAGLSRPVTALRGALIENSAQVPEPVGEAGADVVLGFNAGCGK